MNEQMRKLIQDSQATAKREENLSTYLRGIVQWWDIIRDHATRIEAQLEYLATIHGNDPRFVTATSEIREKLPELLRIVGEKERS